MLVNAHTADVGSSLYALNRAAGANGQEGLRKPGRFSTVFLTIL